MRVSIKFFATAKERAGVSDTSLELPQEATAEEAVTKLIQTFPLLRELRPFMRVAVNLSYVELSHRLQENDEVAVIPPVSGG